MVNTPPIAAFERKSSRHQSNVSTHNTGRSNSAWVWNIWFKCSPGTSSLNLLQHNVTEIYKWFRTLSLEHPSTVTVNVSIGKTYFERDIMAVHITDRSVNGHKPKIYLQCLLHASMYVWSFKNSSKCPITISYHILPLPGEWITGSVCMYIARYLAAPDTSNLMVSEYEQQIFPYCTL